jgi:RimJ/RimL family protein N-acetyltransferase
MTLVPSFETKRLLLKGIAADDVGFWLGKKFWGQGYMTEAVEPAMDYAFNSLDFNSLVFANAVGNIRSRRIKEKTGARLADVKPASFVDPQYTQHEVWTLSKDDWFKFRTTDDGRPKNITPYTEIQESEAVDR